MKYVKKQVSVIFEHHVKNLSADENGNVVLEQRWNEPFENYSKPMALNSPSECQKFMCDFVHLTGNAKPWMTYTPEDVLNSEVKPRTPNELWWHIVH